MERLVLILVAALLPLAACGSDDEEPRTPKVGEVIFARSEIDLGRKSDGFILLPSGRLDVRSGKPVATITADDTREREGRTAPDGSVFVPLSWTYSTDAMSDFDAVFGRRAPISVTLVSDHQRYPLTPPQEQAGGTGSEAFYVSVEGEASDLTLEVEYADVTQSLDLVTGKRQAGRAKALYDLRSYPATTSLCPNQKWFDLPADTYVQFGCTVTKPLATPFAAGEWAAKGHTFVVVGLTSNLSDYRIQKSAEAAAVYQAASSKEKTTLGGKRPQDVLLESEQGAMNSEFLVFDVEGSIPKRLEFSRTYRLNLASVQGRVDAKQSLSLEVSGPIPLRF